MPGGGGGGGGGGEGICSLAFNRDSYTGVLANIRTYHVTATSYVQSCHVLMLFIACSADVTSNITFVPNYGENIVLECPVSTWSTHSIVYCIMVLYP